MLESWLATLALFWSVMAPAPALDPDRARATTQGDRAEISRLEGHAVSILGGDGTGSVGSVHYTIDDIAGQGPPWIGVVRAQGSELFLDTQASGSMRLLGPLARPRIAGPGYKVWVVGQPRDQAALLVRRIGVLAPPDGHTRERP